VAQALTAMAFAGVVTVLLQLPTSAIADGTGRQPFSVPPWRSGRCRPQG
jgi:hypothetical protein